MAGPSPRVVKGPPKATYTIKLKAKTRVLFISLSSPITHLHKISSITMLDGGKRKPVLLILHVYFTHFYIEMKIMQSKATSLLEISIFKARPRS